MLQFALKRVAVALGVAFTVAVLSFFLLHLSGDLAVAIAGPDSSAEQIAQIRVEFGLDKPIGVQFVDWLWRALHLDFGRSFYFQDQVTTLIGGRLGVTMTLGGLALAFALAVAIPLGVVAAIRRDTWVDRFALTLSVFGQAMPSFWFALTLVLIFAVELRWLPASGTGTWKHMVMPVVALGTYAMPAIMRLTRNGMLDVLASDYIRTARAKGLRPAAVLFKHALRNAVIPVVGLAAVQLGFMLGGSIVIETVFSLHGLGHLAWEAISRNDYPVVQAVVLLLSVVYIAVTLVADLLNAALDPRMRSS
ncbi:putative peptide transporter permease subunit: membrane component of ABC superfamily [uncultured Alphaproteobacteria bacterium]|uniref:Putative peptide transporter permease subunit: membrane component of ABC superfamily n=1 Tax=uncultured Alphaproteobacteria bacterium TaxID=91750 RepID=A0A212K460_9PROT|nr:putative peptide transporter permease subunit: membrane component of ABC superfamily [uncultured Alphaproteobacteria bacterium]